MSRVRCVLVAGVCGMVVTVGTPPVAADGSLSNFPWSTTVAVPPGGMQYTGSPPLPRAVRSVKVTVDVDNPQMLLALHSILASKNKRGRVLFCAHFGEGVLGMRPETRARMQGLALTLACFQMINQIPLAQALDTELRVSPCPAVQYRAPMTMTHTAGQYVTTLTGPPRPAKKPPVRVKCAMVGNSVKMTVRSRTRTSLRSYVGPQLFLGFSAEQSMTEPVTARVTYQSVR